MSDLMRQILVAVNMGGQRVHNRYLPEVLALVCSGKLLLVRADATGIEVRPLIG